MSKQRDDYQGEALEAFDAGYNDGFTQGRVLGKREGKDAALLSVVVGLEPKQPVGVCPIVDGEVQHLFVVGQLACQCRGQYRLSDGRIITPNLP